MEQLGNHYLLRNPRTDILSGTEEKVYATHAIRFTQSEDLFINISDPIHVPSFAIHHDVNIKVPSQSYYSKLAFVLHQIKSRLPWLFEGLSWVFDPTDIMHPIFASVYKVDQQHYLYMLRLDLNVHHQYVRVLEPSTNDTTATYDTNSIFIEADLIPVTNVERTKEGLQYRVLQSVSETWIGERGRGYFVQGIWLDNDLTKFFSRLFIPTGKRLYPWYPFNCKYRAVCAQVVQLDSVGRKKCLSLLHSVRIFLEKNMDQIENSIRNGPFNEEDEIYKKLKAIVGQNGIGAELTAYDVSAYLNAEDQKEYELKFHVH